MKTIPQRLQSRISKRRNLIRHVENDVAVMKTQRHTIRSLDIGPDAYGIMSELGFGISNGRKLVSELADDQKLDKQLSFILTRQERQFRYLGF